MFYREDSASAQDLEVQFKGLLGYGGLSQEYWETDMEWNLESKNNIESWGTGWSQALPVVDFGGLQGLILYLAAGFHSFVVCLQSVQPK